MKRVVFAAVMASVRMAAAESQSSHEGPAEILNNSVHIMIRGDTLLDRYVVAQGLRDRLLQHIHEQPHTIQVLGKGHHHAPARFTLRPTDELHFRLTGPRRLWGLLPGRFIGFLTVKPDASNTKIGGNVAGHKAIANESGLRGDTIESRLDPGDRKSFHWVWTYLAPTGYKFEPEQRTDADVTNILNALGQSVTHKQARDAASQVSPAIRYQLTPGSGGLAPRIERFYIVPANQKPSGHGVKLKLGAKVQVCENEKQSDGSVRPLCQAP